MGTFNTPNAQMTPNNFQPNQAMPNAQNINNVQQMPNMQNTNNSGDNLSKSSLQVSM